MTWCSSISTRCAASTRWWESGRRRAADPNLVITAKDALAPFLDKWVPVPFLQVRPNNHSREGPATGRACAWSISRRATARANRDEQGNRYRCVLAFDTGLIAEAEGRAYLAPSPKDVTSGALFALAPQQRANHWLLRQGWMTQWLEELFREQFPRATLEEIDGDIKQKPQEAVARYLAFLGLLADAVHFPRSSWWATPSGRAAAPSRSTWCSTSATRGPAAC